MLTFPSRSACTHFSVIRFIAEGFDASHYNKGIQKTQRVCVCAIINRPVLPFFPLSLLIWKHFTAYNTHCDIQSQETYD